MNPVFNKDGSISFLKPPRENEKRYWIQSKKPSEDLEKYLNSNFKNLFDFFEFYTNHFRKKVPESEKAKRSIISRRASIRSKKEDIESQLSQTNDP